MPPLSPRLDVWILEGSHELLWGRSQGDFMEAVSHQDNQVTSGQLVWGCRSQQSQSEQEDGGGRTAQDPSGGLTCSPVHPTAAQAPGGKKGDNTPKQP